MSPSRPPVFPSYTFHIIPHTHWDREWYLTRSGFQARLIPVLDEVVDQLEAEPTARFLLDGQTLLLEDYLAARPERRARVMALVARGALEIGPWYVLSDLLIPSAPSLRRNLAEGLEDSTAFGGRTDVLYSPDAFGHPAELPALAAEFGIKRAVVRRGLGRPLGQDRDLYRWESAGGESVLVYHLPPGGYDTAIDLAGEGADLAAFWPPLRDELVARAASDQVAVFLGADHHAMARNVADFQRRLQRLEPSHRVRMSSLHEYFDAVEQGAPALGVIKGELRRIDGHTWVLQGIHGTRSRMRRRHSRAELILSRIAEPLADAAEKAGGLDRGGVVALAWRTLLQCQFHDTIAGTTSDAVQREQDVRLDSVESLCREIAAPALRELALPGTDTLASRLVVWNPSDRPRGGIMTADLTFFVRDVLVGPPSERQSRTGAGHQAFALVDPSGASIPVQLLAQRREQERIDSPRHYPDQDEVDRVWIAFEAPTIPGKGVAILAPNGLTRAASSSASDLRVGAGVLANAQVEVRVSPAGFLTITDRSTGETYRGQAELEDEEDHGDTYTFSPGRGAPIGKRTPLSSRVVASGPLVGAVETRWSMSSAGTGYIGVRLLVVLHADSPIVRLRLDVDNQATNHRLRARFPVGAGTAAVAGTAFGREQREPVVPAPDRHAIERPVRTAPAQRFVAAGHGARGMVILAPGFFEYEWTAKQELIVTLTRSVGELSRNDLPERPGHAAWPMPTPGAQEIGLHIIELALVAGSSHAELEQRWEDAFLPILSIFERNDRP